MSESRFWSGWWCCTDEFLWKLSLLLATAPLQRWCFLPLPCSTSRFCGSLSIFETSGRGKNWPEGSKLIWALTCETAVHLLKSRRLHKQGKLRNCRILPWFWDLLWAEGILSAGAASGGGSVLGLYSCVAPVAVAVRYLYINVHSAASAPCCALPQDCEEMSKKIEENWLCWSCNLAS